MGLVRRHGCPFMVAAAVLAACARGWSGEPDAAPPRVSAEERAAIEFRFSRDRLTDADRRLLGELASFADAEGRPRFALKTEREAHLTVTWACWLLEAEALKTGRPLTEANAVGGAVRRTLDGQMLRLRNDRNSRTFTAWHRERPTPGFGADDTLALDARHHRWTSGTFLVGASSAPESLIEGMRIDQDALGISGNIDGFGGAPFDVSSLFERMTARLSTMDAVTWPALTVGLAATDSRVPVDPRDVSVGSMIGVNEPADLAQAARVAMPDTFAPVTWTVVMAENDKLPRLGHGPTDQEAWSAALAVSGVLSLFGGTSASLPASIFGSAPTWLYGDSALPSSTTGSLSRETTRVDRAWMPDAALSAATLANAPFQPHLQRPGDFLRGLYVTKPGDRPSANLGAPALAGGMNGWAAWRALLRDENAPVVRHADPETSSRVRDEILRTLSPSRVSIDGRINQGLTFAWKLHHRTGGTFADFRRAAEHADGSWTNDARGLAALTAWAIKRKAWDDALSLAEAWLEQDDTSAESWYNAAQSAWALGKLDLVGEYAAGLLHLFPASPRRAHAYWLLGLAAGERQRPDTQRQHWARLIAEHPKTNEAKEARKRLAAPPAAPEPLLPPPVHTDIGVF